IILEGAEDLEPGPHTVWREYEFKCKPGDVHRAPCVVSPYHYKIDWQMWFAAMSGWRYNPWILNFTAKLLKNDPATLSLIAKNPFPEKPPKYIRARLYRYRFTTVEEKKQTGAWWSRTFLRDYLPPLSLENPALRDILNALGIPL
ncbi:MAG TPA: lipase maturation factor family protein, partial [bacterium]|nr:lipase maturation factor family protein [bacterium]